MSRSFIFGGESSAAYHVYVFEGDTYNAPSRSYTSSAIPGKNGALLVNNKRFDNVQHSFACFVVEDFETNIQAFRNFLNSKIGYQRLEDTAHSDEYYMACYKNNFVVTPSNNLDMGKVTVTFDRKPQRFLKSGETAVTLTSDGSITNPTRFSAKPLIRIYGTGRVGVGSNAITVATADGYTDVDCEIMEAYKGTQSRNAYVTIQDNDFPELKPGANGITLGTGVERVDITPRWWRL